MADDQEDFGYKVSVRAEPSRSAPRPVYYVCSNCGSDDIEAKWYCQWSVEKQVWTPYDRVDGEDYCNQCGDCMEIEEREYGS